MFNPLALPILGGSLVVSAMVGIHLGQSSIEMINPIHFQGPALHPRDRGVAIDENDLLPPPQRVAYANLYGWEQGRLAQMADCGDCRMLGRDDASVYSATVPYFGPGQTSRPTRRASEPEGEIEQAVLAAVAEQPPARSLVERYAHYPIAEEDVAESEPEPVFAEEKVEAW